MLFVRKFVALGDYMIISKRQTLLAVGRVAGKSNKIQAGNPGWRLL